ncbi:MAG TPA: acyltransferase family protein [Ktedonobacterales bacterium]|jgi:peptidoglycan/LPS O-acetylase OafA/YrhL|nr:acyltransferase family protein [Ktedonobacterales bacterium]
MTTLASIRARESVSPVANAIPRRYELDWLRALVVLGLIPIHAAVIFSSTADTYVKNSQTNQLMALLGAFAGAWGMPLLFLVAGAAAYFALNRRTTAAYLKERAMRLLVPFIVATLLIVPVQVYAVALNDPSLISGYGVPIHNPQFLSSYPAFYVEYLRGYVYFLTHFSTTLAIVFWGHLWFIPRLLAYALCAIPLFIFLRSQLGARMTAGLNRLLRYPGAIFLLALPLMLVEMLMRASQVNALTAHWPLYDDWVQFAFYLVCFIYGYLVFAVSAMPGAIARHGWVALGLGVIGFAVALTQARGLTINPLNYSLGYIAGWPVRGLVSWFWVIAILSFALTRLSFTNGLLRYLNDAVFPIYVLHMPVVTIVGVYVVRMDIPWPVKFALIIVSAFGLTLALYELLIRRFAPMRLLFGLKPRAAHGDSAQRTPQSRRSPHFSGGDDNVR